MSECSESDRIDTSSLPYKYWYKINNSGLTLDYELPAYPLSISIGVILIVLLYKVFKPDLSWFTVDPWAYNEAPNTHIRPVHDTHVPVHESRLIRPSPPQSSIAHPSYSNTSSLDSEDYYYNRRRRYDDRAQADCNEARCVHASPPPVCPSCEGLLPCCCNYHDSQCPYNVNAGHRPRSSSPHPNLCHECARNRPDHRH